MVCRRKKVRNLKIPTLLFDDTKYNLCELKPQNFYWRNHNKIKRKKISRQKLNTTKMATLWRRKYQRPESNDFGTEHSSG